MPDAHRYRRRILVSGIVQGVGFRPFVYRVAAAHRVSGFVQNTTSGVTIEVEGAREDLDALAESLVRDAPPLARIASVAATEIPVQSSTAFAILDSVATIGRSWLPPDVAMCGDCRRELHDPTDRRYRHPFITCTNCGPRYTVIASLPYDRATTTMAPFPLCAPCAHEYRTPAGRRFHAETIACHDCGPRLTFTTSAGESGRAEGEAALGRVGAILAEGGIVAVKGVGGFHLMCDATSPRAVDMLRRRKHRPHKPFAIVVADIERAERAARLSPHARGALTSTVRPIVLLERAPDCDVVPDVAPRLAHIGLMLPHAPVHELIVGDWAERMRSIRPDGTAALILTSGNRAEDPVAIDDDDARARLADLADAFLLHDRRILARCDDSVVADGGSRAPLPIRRSRGLSPAPIPVAHVGRPILAAGGELKATCCLAVDGQAVMSPHIGDMANADTLDALSAAVDHLCKVHGVEPEIYVCDAHPGYLSAQWAEQAAAGRVVRTQHHHAHAASLMAEHALSLDDHLVTVCFDGTGYGDDGAVWGGEVLKASYRSSQRLAHLAYAPLVGGDGGVRHPARLALAYLDRAGAPSIDALPMMQQRSTTERRLVAEQLRAGIGVVPTSSMGRLFDVVSAIAGVCGEATYEGQAAVELEVAASGGVAAETAYGFEWRPDRRGIVQVQWEPVVRAVAADVLAGVPASVIAARFHHSVADMVAGLMPALLQAATRRRVGLTGGVFQNGLLVRLVATRLERLDIEVLTHLVVPPNDGGLSLGQAAIAAARHPILGGA